MSGTLGVLISGRGTNLQAILDSIKGARLHARIGLVLSNVPDAPGLERARSAGAPTLVLEHKRFPSREAFDGAVVEELRRCQVDLVCLAGFMRLLSPHFIRAFRGRVLNIHPSLLPAFPGLRAQRQALDHGVKVSGCTVHLVDDELDHGPILMQAPVPVLDSDTEKSLSERILQEEHRIYPEAIGLMLDGRFEVVGRRALLRS